LPSLQEIPLTFFTANIGRFTYLMALMAGDVVIMPPNEAVLRGKAAVHAWYEQLLTQMRTSSLTITNREVFIGGDWATEVAAFKWALVPVAGGPPVIDRGSYVQVWHREPGGRWRFSREVWNTPRGCSLSHSE
jgi:ketosteroid isomerase-like protein